MKTVLMGMLALFSSAVWAQDGVYRIDMVVFTRADSQIMLRGMPVSPENATSGPRVDMDSLGSDNDARFVPHGAVSPAIDEASAILGKRGYRVVLQRAWTQPPLMGDDAMAVRISGGQHVLDQREVEGEVRVTHDETPLIETRLRVVAVPTGAAPAITSDPAAGPDPEAWRQARAVLLQDRRRITPDALTYLDHPDMGVLVVVSRTGTLPGLETAAPAETPPGAEILTPTDTLPR